MSIARFTAPRRAVFHLLRRLHFYIGLFIAPFIFVAALSGTLYVLTPQLEDLLYSDVLTVEPHGTAHPLSEQIHAARAYIGEQQPIDAVRPASSDTETTRVQFSDPALGESQSRAVFIDPYTLQVKGDMAVYGTSGVLPLRMTIDLLHRSLLLGDLGRNYSELAASWLWIAALGGVILWLGTRPKRTPKSPRKGFALQRHWHTTLGLVLFLGLIFVSITGLTWSQWAGNNIGKLRTEMNWLTPQVNTSLHHHAAAPADPHAEHHAMAGMHMSMTNTTDSAWDHVLHAARQNGIDATKLELRQPKNADSAWTVTEIDRQWPTQVDAVAVNPHDFTILDHIYFDQFPLMAKLTRWGVDAHMGVLFGLPNQILMALFGLGLCSMIVFGYRMWWIRRPKMGKTHPLQTLTEAWLALPLALKACCLLLAIGLGVALPAMGISLLLLIVVDLYRWRRQ